MANLKDIAATLAILGSGALTVAGCEKDKGATEVPGGTQAAQPEESGEASCGGEKGEGSCGGGGEGSCGAKEGGDGEASCGGML